MMYLGHSLDEELPLIREEISKLPQRRAKKISSVNGTVFSCTTLFASCSGSFLSAAISAPWIYTGIGLIGLNCIYNNCLVKRNICVPQCGFNYDDALAYARNQYQIISELSGINEFLRLTAEKQKLQNVNELTTLKNRNTTDSFVKSQIRFFNKSGYPKIPENKEEIIAARQSLV